MCTTAGWRTTLYGLQGVFEAASGAEPHAVRTSFSGSVRWMSDL